MARDVSTLVVILVLVCGVQSTGAAEAGTPQKTKAESTDFDEFDNEFSGDDNANTNDPLESYNRVMFSVNDKAYLWVVEPVAKGYGKVVPEKGRVAVSRAFGNLAFPKHFINNMLQGKFSAAGVEAGRFGLNTTLGLLGLFDVADTRYGLAPEQEDFGQTLARYRVGHGFPLVLPLLGPSSLRDTVGLVGDYMTDPVSYIDPSGLRLGVRAYKRTNGASLRVGEYRKLRDDAVDPYRFFRDVYRQHRDSKIEE